jgi:hypothetical protein
MPSRRYAAWGCPTYFTVFDGRNHGFDQVVARLA